MLKTGDSETIASVLPSAVGQNGTAVVGEVVGKAARRNTPGRRCARSAARSAISVSSGTRAATPIRRPARAADIATMAIQRVVSSYPRRSRWATTLTPGWPRTSQSIRRPETSLVRIPRVFKSA